MNTKRFSEAMNEIDSRYVYKALNYQPKRRTHFPLFAASVAVFLILCGFAYTIHVYQGVGSASHIDFDTLTQPFGTIANEQKITNPDNEIFSERSNLINSYETIYAVDSVCVETNLNQIPSIYFSPTYMVIFSQKDEQGWELKSDEKLTLNFSLHHTQSIELEIGYVLNGEYYTLSVTKGCDFKETLTASAEGEYYFCVTNHSSGNAVIENGSIIIEPNITF